MTKKQIALLQQTDQNITLLKKQMLKGDFVIDQRSIAVIEMLKTMLQEMSAIARLVEQR
jgi:hypothetical protein